MHNRNLNGNPVQVEKYGSFLAVWFSDVLGVLDKTSLSIFMAITQQPGKLFFSSLS